MGYLFLGLLCVFLLFPLIVSLAEWLFMPPLPEGQAFVYPSHHGRHYVLYPDGKRSGYMKWEIAKDYAEIFGGEVYCYPKPSERKAAK